MRLFSFSSFLQTNNSLFINLINDFRKPLGCDTLIKLVSGCPIF
ncbi:hypothetical protein M153_50000314 [Pseudoloma neurophilia]|uniref:Uncharacterized protein n=1 Tax=Pseudoloma neurophilia TaxID=146866 RepID=A0A0R0M634_9MICR|nr:hypothetical protein M153_50000314 [Pseudoloma neurophilia]